MTILTSKMKTTRSDHYGSNCKVWFPCNETTGDNLVDRISGTTIAGTGASGYATAHGVNFVCAADLATTNMGQVSIPKQGLLMMVQKVSTSFALTQIILGHSTSGPSLRLSGGSGVITIPGTTATTVTLSSSAAATNIICAALAWDNTASYAYEGINGAAALGNSSSHAANMKTALAANTKFSQHVSINSSLQSIVYGFALFDFSDSGLPSDLLTGINAMRSDWVQGRKQLYAGWKERI